MAQSQLVAGLMSGTSLDGVDIAVIETDGETVTAFGPSRECAYAPAHKAQLVQATARARETDSAILADRARWPDWLRDAEALTTRLHAEAVAELGAASAMIGFHGQTLVHRPDEGFTLQIGDGAALARMCGVDVAWDFRSADMAAGGQGAPLAPFHHFALARRMGGEGPIAFLNLGGVANVTWVDPARSAPEAADALLAFDTGPGNGMLDALMTARTGAAADYEGATAARGRVDETALSALLDHPYFRRRPPKSLDRYDFSMEPVANLSTEDAGATLTTFTAESAMRALEYLPAAPVRWLICGGGRRNPTLMAALGARLPGGVEPVEAAGLDGDMIEAQTFAYLAMRVARGLPLSAPGSTGCCAPMRGGRISRP